MNADASRRDNNSTAGEVQSATGLPVVGDGRAGGVPVFSCIAYVSQNADGGVQVRVANLAELSFSAPTEREALAKAISAFKQRIAEFIQRDDSIPWIDPPSPAEPNEQQRFIPVHL